MRIFGVIMICLGVISAFISLISLDRGPMALLESMVIVCIGAGLFGIGRIVEVLDELNIKMGVLSAKQKPEDK